MDVNHTCKIPSWQCQDQCLNHWRLAWPSWHRKLTITVSIKFLWFEKLQRLHYYYYICSPSGFALKSIFCGVLNKWALLVLCIHDRELLGKEQCLLEILKCSVPSPDLWPSEVRGLVQTWARRTISLSWSLPLPHPVSVVGLSNVSVWVTVFPAPGRLRPAGLVASKLVSDSWSNPKCWKSVGSPPSHRARGRGGARSASSSDPHIVSLKKKFLLGEYDPPMVSPYVWPSVASSQTVLKTETHDSSWISIR